MAYSIGSSAIKNNNVVIIPIQPQWNNNFETIERKGVGHPDTIADILAQKVSRNYSKYTITHCEGRILHHQIDKLMIIGGKTEVTFGKGKFVKPIRILVAGRVSYTYKDIKIPVDQIIKDTIFHHFDEYFPLVSKNAIVIKNFLTDYAGPGTIKQSTGAIAQMFNPKDKNSVRGYEKYVANDTSYCVAYAPLSPLEQSVLTIEKYLNSKETKKIYPWLGTDIKIMAVRNNDSVGVTMCIPQIAKYVKSFREYSNNLQVIGNVVNNMFEKLLPNSEVDIAINTKDDYEKMNLYLTVSGASLSGDIGVVGRGNRTNGLITSNRPMSLEGTSGKNPLYYSGFIYAHLTRVIAERIYNDSSEAAIVEIVSQNGNLLSKPWQVRIITKADKNVVETILADGLNNIEHVTENFLNEADEIF